MMAFSLYLLTEALDAAVSWFLVTGTEKSRLEKVAHGELV